MTIFWLVVGVVLLGVEALTVAFFGLFIALGCFAGAVVAALGADAWVQVLLAVGVALLGIVIARPPVMRAVRNRGPITLPGVQGLVGQQAVTVDVVGDEHHPGHALLAGERWLAVTDGGSELAPDMTVTVAAVRGTTLVVRPLARGARA
jgi:membrane protein implicated in regulation of membrane protease activity